MFKYDLISFPFYAKFSNDNTKHKNTLLWLWDQKKALFSVFYKYKIFNLKCTKYFSIKWFIKACIIFIIYAE